ncbi:uncharacterized protein LOC115926553 [Strongylocentrotus purpuratus]|uniref:Uncharacterized protein n=1 Tax=Strongylocentrotus purpuratus TaxID=7668 RepID=A0A7M7PCL8_STRPU|nr:uncharacterized protein LOC115926553 [Strongylocentrotus purpuratus]
MGTTKMLLTALCLSVMICACASRRWNGPRPKPSTRFTEACAIFDNVKIREKAPRCNKNVLDKVADLDEKVNIFPYQYMRRLYRWARNGMLCYAQTGQAIEVSGPCEAMELSCSSRDPKPVDHCWRVTGAAKPPGRPQAPQNPQAPPPNPPGHL